MSTIHNPKNFIPENYAPTAYLDNRAPEAGQFFGFMPADVAAEMLAASREQYNAAFAEFFGWRIEGKQANIPHKCVHCGAALRYVVAVHHAPTNSFVPFGTDCADRCDMTLDTFKLKALKDVAKKRAETIKAGGRFNAYMEKHPELAKLVEEYKAAGASYGFVDDVLRRLRADGGLSDRQLAALFKAIPRSIQWAEERKARDEADRAAKEAIRAEGKTMEEGRRKIEGDVLTVKVQDSYYGTTLKMLVRDSDGFKYWGSVPSSIDVDKGSHVVLTATVSRSDDDEFFGFFKRPAKAAVVDNSAESTS